MSPRSLQLLRRLYCEILFEPTASPSQGTSFPAAVPRPSESPERAPRAS